MATVKDTIPQADLEIIVDMPADRAPPARCQGRGNAARRAIGTHRRQHGRPLSVDLAARIHRPVGDVAELVGAFADLGHRPEPGLERV
jgi:hypothetical protein